MSRNPPIKLTPEQKTAYRSLLTAMRPGSILALQALPGRGKSTILRKLAQARGAAFLTCTDFVKTALELHPMALEEAFYRMVSEALDSHDVVIVDDYHVVTKALTDRIFSMRDGLIDAHLTALIDRVLQSGKSFAIGTSGKLPDPIATRCHIWTIEAFGPEDYRFLCEIFFGKRPLKHLEFAKIHRVAPRLNAYHLRTACRYLALLGGLVNTDIFIQYLVHKQLTSNVCLEEVTPVDLSELRGLDDVIESIEAQVVLPLENDVLAEEIGLQPKRGILLLGPPGSGKTTIGKALAHRLKGKFFLIDGTCISGASEFYSRVQQVFEKAKENAPAIIFIDDSDVIFENGKDQGLYRYLLTMLDGLESKSSRRICVVLTAMNVANIPPALIRSGRIELWLELRLPDDQARAEILERLAADLHEDLASLDVAQIVSHTEGFTGADLRRIIEEGKTFFAHDLARGRQTRSPTSYFLAAVEAVAGNKQRYRKALGQENSDPPKPQLSGMLE